MLFRSWCPVRAGQEFLDHIKQAVGVTDVRQGVGAWQLGAPPPGVSSRTNAASGATPGFAWPAMGKITINFGSPFGSLTIFSRIAACLWPAKTVGATGIEPVTPRL